MPEKTFECKSKKEETAKIWRKKNGARDLVNELHQTSTTNIDRVNKFPEITYSDVLKLKIQFGYLVWIALTKESI